MKGKGRSIASSFAYDVLDVVTALLIECRIGERARTHDGVADGTEES